MTTPTPERILIVENDTIISDLLSRQALKSAGYQTYVAPDSSTAIARAVQLSPDVIIVDLSIPGLSGKDLMVAFSAQNSQTPLIVLARKGTELDIIQAFRLGATDYLIWPVREAEVVAVVERALKQVRERRERDQLSHQLQQTNQELQARVRELTTIFSIGKAVTSITDQSLLFERILEGAARVTQSDMGWMLLRDEAGKNFVMVAQRDLPASATAFLNQPFDDGISSLVAMSGEPLSIHGEPIKRFRIASFGHSALIVPIKVQRQVVGLLVGVRKAAAPFTPSEQHLMEAVADYASISLVNARLFREVEGRARSLQSQSENAQAGEKITNEILQTAKKELRPAVDVGQQALERLASDPGARWTAEQRKSLSTLQEQMQRMGRITEAVLPLSTSPSPARFKIGDLIQQAVKHCQPFAQQNDVSLIVEGSAVQTVHVSAGQIVQVLIGMLTNAIKFSNPGGHVTVSVDKAAEGQLHIAVTDTGIGVDPVHFERIFEGSYQPDRTRPVRFGGLGIGLGLAREIITRHGGKLWVESKPGQGAAFHLTLPAVP